MSDKFKNSKLFAKFKDANANRATIITTVMLVAAIVVIVSVTVAANRSKKNNELPDPPVDQNPTVDDKKDPEPEPEVKDPEPEQKEDPPANETSKPVSDPLPSLILPVKGHLLKGHDASLQVFSNTMNDYRVHLGVDLVTEENAPVYAAADGKIAKIWEDVKMGYCISIEHSGDALTVYKNLGETLPEGIAEGVSVRSGQLIATVGSSAMVEIAEEPHLHFEMTVGGLAVDPLEYYDESALEALKADTSYEE